MADVFLSYAEEDRPRAAQVAACLSRFGRSVWWDRSILPGKRYRQIIDAELATARSVVVLWSPRSVVSRWVCDEADEAIEREILIQAVIEPVRPPRGFRQDQVADLTTWDGDWQAEVIQGLMDAIAVFTSPVARIAQVSAVTRPILTEHVPPTPSDPRWAPKLFVSYRRIDSGAQAMAINASLIKQFGPAAIFLDIDLLPAEDLHKDLAEMISNCKAMLVVIGTQWITAADHKGRRWLDNSDDFVRMEIALALQHDIPVIPVLVNGAEMPSASALPKDIRPLSHRNGIELSSGRWRTDVERLIKELDRVMKPGSDNR